MTERQPVHVAAAVITDDRGRVLLTKRAEHLHQGGLWEFPGGKLEPGENTGQALCREIQEELGIEITGHRPLIATQHHYTDKSVLLDVHKVISFRGTPKALEGQPMEWVEIEDLPTYDMPEADLPILKAISLPDSYMITGPDPYDREQFLKSLEHALENGLRLVQLRLGDVPADMSLDLGRDAVSLCHAHDARLLLNGDPVMVERIGADGVHLNRHRLQQLTGRPFPDSYLVAASCHNPEELRKASVLGVDFAVLSPVQPTASHPGAEVLGWKRFSEMASVCPMPVFSLGGMRREDMELAWQHGAQGIAGISCFWS